jgi:hypothetical protein
MEIIIDILQGTLVLSFVLFLAVLTVGSIMTLIDMQDDFMNVRTRDKVVAVGWSALMLLMVILSIGMSI